MAARVLVVCPEPIGKVRTGVGIRLSEMARVLAARHEVTLAAPAVEGLEEAPYRTGRNVDLARLLRAADVAIVHGHVSNDLLDLEPSIPLVFDLYDPFVVENLAYAEAMGPGVFRHDRATLERQLRHGDFFLAASGSQRAFYLGMLTLLSRVNAASFGRGATLEHLVAVVPFGVDETPPAKPGGFRDRLGLAAAPFVFYGGIYDWYDPIAALDAFALVRRRVPTARMLFVRHPRQETTPQTLFGRTLEHAGKLGLRDAIVLADWIPYEERGRVLVDADVGFVTHRPGIETELSFRTRVLDFLWAGLPVVASKGGAASELVTRSGGGRVVDGVAESADAVARYLEEPALRAHDGAAGQRHVLETMTWSRSLAPLSAWLEAPRRDPDKPPPPSPNSRWKRMFGK